MKNIAVKLVKIMNDCKYVQKKGVNSFHKYKYALAADVLEKVSESCVHYGVATVSNAEILEWKPIDKQSKEGIKTEFFATVKVSIMAIDQDSGESITFSGVGCGQDVGDKAVMKAETAAIKYAWMTTLNIATGDDPEADETVDQRNAEAIIKPQSKQPKEEPKPQRIEPKTYKCSDCDSVISERVYDFSMNNSSMKKSLCKNCQQKYKKVG